MAKTMCGIELVDKKMSRDVMQMVELEETIDQLAKANSVCWHLHVFRKDKSNHLRIALDFRVRNKVKGRPLKTWIKVVVEQSRFRVERFD